MKTVNVDVRHKDFNFRDELPICKYEDQKDVAKSIYKILSDACILYFGIHSTQIQEVVIFKAIEKINKEFNSISLKEIEHSFERLDLQRQVTITLDDLINPIKKYLYVKNYITVEEQKHIKEMQERDLEIIKSKEFEESSLTTYRLSLQKNEWKGNIFNAHAIAKKYLADKFSQEEKSEIFSKAKQQRLNVEAILDSDPLKICEFVGHTDERLFSNMIVIEAVNRGIEI